MLLWQPLLLMLPLLLCTLAMIGGMELATQSLLLLQVPCRQQHLELLLVP